MASNSVSPVTILDRAEDLQKTLASAEKLVVLEFVKQDSQICKYVRPERNRIAKEMKEKAEFYELDVDTFKKYAEEFKVEALPAFLVMQKFVKKRHVVGTDDLKEAIEGAHTPNEPAQNSGPKVNASDPIDDDGSQPDSNSEEEEEEEEEEKEEEEEQSTVSDDSDWYYNEEKNNKCSIL